MLIYFAVGGGSLIVGVVIGFFVGLRAADNAVLSAFRW